MQANDTANFKLYPTTMKNTSIIKSYELIYQSHTLLQVIFQMEIQKIGYFFRWCSAVGNGRSLTDILHALENFR